MNRENIQWLFFDMGGVILNDDKPENLRQTALLEVIKKYEPSFTIADVHKAWAKASEQPGSVRINALKTIFKDSIHLAKAEAEFSKIYKDNYHELSTVRSEAKNVLAKLSPHYKLGIMANQHARTTELLESAGLLPYFSHKKMSAHVGLEKPNPEFFKTILQDSGVKAGESVIIDDNWYRGLLPAKKLGMATVLYQREIIPYPETANPDFKISNLEELLNIFIPTYTKNSPT